MSRVTSNFIRVLLPSFFIKTGEKSSNTFLMQKIEKNPFHLGNVFKLQANTDTNILED